ncbi:unnamed protein product, partial [Meganyctiphanes norvegica]
CCRLVRDEGFCAAEWCWSGISRGWSRLPETMTGPAMVLPSPGPRPGSKLQPQPHKPFAQCGSHGGERTNRTTTTCGVSYSVCGRDWSWVVVLCIWVVLCPPPSCFANPDAKRLYDDLLSSYNRLIRPVENNTDKLTVKLGLKLSQLIDV